MINARDNLHRTSFHYACIIDDQVSIDILELTDAKPMLDCMNLSPEDYTQHRDLCSEEFRAKDFSSDELQRRSDGISDFLKISFYPTLRKAIERDASDELKLIHQEMIQMGFHMKDLHPHSYQHDYCHGQRYVPLFFIALQHRSLACIRYLTEIGVPSVGRMYLSVTEAREMFNWIPPHQSTAGEEEELKYLDMVNLLEQFEHDLELKMSLGQHVVPLAAAVVENPAKPTVIEVRSSNSQQRWKSLFKKKQENSNSKAPNCIIH